MRHEEAVLIDAEGIAFYHAVAELRELNQLRYPLSEAARALDGGVILHSHTLPFGTSFSLSDLVPLLCISESSRGGVLVVTTSHHIHNVMRRCRYIVDTRRHPYRPLFLDRLELKRRWEDQQADVDKRFVKLVGVKRPDDEVYAAAQHKLVTRPLGSLGVSYRRELVI